MGANPWSRLWSTRFQYERFESPTIAVPTLAVLRGFFDFFRVRIRTSPDRLKPASCPSSIVWSPAHEPEEFLSMQVRAPAGLTGF